MAEKIQGSLQPDETDNQKVQGSLQPDETDDQKVQGSLQGEQTDTPEVVGIPLDELTSREATEPTPIGEPDTHEVEGIPLDELTSREATEPTPIGEPDTVQVEGILIAGLAGREATKPIPTGEETSTEHVEARLLGDKAGAKSTEVYPGASRTPDLAETRSAEPPGAHEVLGRTQDRMIEVESPTGKMMPGEGFTGSRSGESSAIPGGSGIPGFEDPMGAGGFPGESGEYVPGGSPAPSGTPGSLPGEDAGFGGGVEPTEPGGMGPEGAEGGPSDVTGSSDGAPVITGAPGHVTGETSDETAGEPEEAPVWRPLDGPDEPEGDDAFEGAKADAGSAGDAFEGATAKGSASAGSASTPSPAAEAADRYIDAVVTGVGRTTAWGWEQLKKVLFPNPQDQTEEGGERNPDTVMESPIRRPGEEITDPVPDFAEQTGSIDVSFPHDSIMLTEEEGVGPAILDESALEGFRVPAEEITDPVPDEGEDPSLIGENG